MKKFSLVFLGLMAITQVGFARSIDTTGVIANVSFTNNFNLENAALLEDGRLQVEVAGNVMSEQLSPVAFSDLQSKAITLANAALKTEHRQFVCMTFVAVMSETLSVSRYDENGQRFTNESRVILTPNGCYLRDVVSPADTYNRSLAEELKGQISILAKQMVQPK